MSTPKKRTVRFFRPVRQQPDGSIIELAAGFWEGFRAKLDELDSDAQFVAIRGVQYRGAARKSPLSSTKYLYLGKTRESSDYPESSVGDDDEQPLILEDGGRLVEPCYIYVLNRTSNTIATLRSSGGPSLSAVADWITRFYKSVLGDDTIELEPIVRHDQMERLQEAQNIASFSVKIEKDQHLSGAPQDSPEGVMAGALRESYESLGGGATMDYSWSFGNSQPAPSRGQRLKREALQILNWKTAKSAKATVIRRDHHGDIIREQIDFIKDKVTVRVPVGESSAIVQSSDVVTAALRQASEKFNELDLQ